jgi:hypothetical protein
MLGNSWEAERLAASQEELTSVELINLSLITSRFLHNNIFLLIAAASSHILSYSLLISHPKLEAADHSGHVI